jgi:hypothetical protein
MKLTSKENIQARLCNGYDKGWYDSIWKQMCYAFGEQGQESLGIGGDKRFPDFADLTPTMSEVGTSKRILNTQFITLSRVMYSDPEPEFPDVDKITGQIRQSFYQARATGEEYGDGDWATQFNAAFMDGDGVGTGVVQLGLKTNPKTGFRKLTAQHVPILQTLWDRNERSISRARWIAFLHYIPMDVAEAQFGKRFATENRHEMKESGSEEPIECVRILDYWDIGHGKGEPTHAFIVDDLDGEVIEIEENPYGCLPCAFYEHLLIPGMRRAVGRIPLLMAGQEALNQAERYMREAMKRPGFTMVGAELFEESDFERVINGEGGIIRTKRPLAAGELIAQFVPGEEVSQTTLAYMQLLEKDFTANAGVTEFDRGSNPDQARTLGENQLVDERSKVQASWSALQAAKMHRRAVEVGLKIAAIGDNDPVMLAVDGNTVPINDPSDTRLSIANFLAEPSRVIVSVESLAKNDMLREQQMATQKLMGLQPLVGQTIDPIWWTDELLKANGYDPAEAKLEPQPVPLGPDGMPVDPMGAGAPGTQQQQAA